MSGLGSVMDKAEVGSGRRKDQQVGDHERRQVGTQTEVRRLNRFGSQLGT